MDCLASSCALSVLTPRSRAPRPLRPPPPFFFALPPPKQRHVDRPARRPEGPGPVPVPAVAQARPVVGGQPGTVLDGGEREEEGGGERKSTGPAAEGWGWSTSRRALTSHTRSLFLHFPPQAEKIRAEFEAHKNVSQEAGAPRRGVRERKRGGRAAARSSAPSPPPPRPPPPLTSPLPAHPTLSRRPTSSRPPASSPLVKPAWPPKPTPTSTRSPTARAAPCTPATRPSTPACTRSLTSVGRRPIKEGGGACVRACVRACVCAV